MSEQPLEQPQAAPQPPKKKARQSLTVWASVGAIIIPLAAAFIASRLGVEDETARQIAEGLYLSIIPLIAIGLRRAVGFASLLIVVVFVGCASAPDHREIGTFRELRESFEKVERTVRASKVVRLDEDDPKYGKKNAELNEAERQSVLKVIERSIGLCNEAEGVNHGE